MRKEKTNGRDGGYGPQQCISQGYRLYVSQFRSMFKAAWLPGLVYAVCFSALVTAAVAQKDLWGIICVSAVAGLLAEVYFYAAGLRVISSVADGGRAEAKPWKPVPTAESGPRWQRAYVGMLLTLAVFFVMVGAASSIGYGLAAAINAIGGDEGLAKPLWLAGPLGLVGCLLSVPLVVPMSRYIFRPEVDYWKTLWPAFKVGMGQWTLLFSCLFVALLVMTLLTAVVLLPANVLALASYQSAYGEPYGDPAGMPSYVMPMTIIIMLIAGMAEAFIRLTMVCVMWKAYGAVEDIQREKDEFSRRNEGETE